MYRPLCCCGTCTLIHCPGPVFRFSIRRKLLTVTSVDVTRIIGDGNLTDDVREGEGANEMEGKENDVHPE